MTIDKQLQIAQILLDTRLVNKVYHSCELIANDKGKLYPCYPQGTEYLYAGIDDKKLLYAYIRTNGDATATKMKVQSCANAFEVFTPLRVVFFNDKETRERSFLLTKLCGFTLTKDITLQRIITDKFKLVKEESDVFEVNMDGQVFYAAVDVLVKTILLLDTCEKVECIVHPNPLSL